MEIRYLNITRIKTILRSVAEKKNENWLPGLFVFVLYPRIFPEIKNKIIFENELQFH